MFYQQGMVLGKAGMDDLFLAYHSVYAGVGKSCLCENETTFCRRIIVGVCVYEYC